MLERVTAGSELQGSPPCTGPWRGALCGARKLEPLDLRPQRSNILDPSKNRSRNRESWSTERLGVSVVVQGPTRAHEDADRDWCIVEVEREKGARQPSLLLLPAVPVRRLVRAALTTPARWEGAIKVLGSTIFRSPAPSLHHERDLALNAARASLTDRPFELAASARRSEG